MKYLLLLSFALLAASAIKAQPAETPDSSRTVFFALGLDGGYFSSYGEWQKHRYAPGVDLFKGKSLIRPSIEIHANTFIVGLFYNYMWLAANDWVTYARKNGDVLTVRARLEEFGIAIKHHVLRFGKNVGDLQWGIDYLYFTAQETFAGTTYEYDFVKKFHVGLFIGCGYGYYFDKHFMLYADGKFLWSPSRINYPEKGDFDLMGFPLGLGIRILL